MTAQSTREEQNLSQTAEEIPAEEESKVPIYRNSGQHLSVEASSPFKRGSTDVSKEKGFVTGIVNNEAFNTQENFNTGSNHSSEEKGAATDDQLSNHESNQDDALTMIGFENVSSDFSKLIAKKTPVGGEADGEYMS